MSDDPIPTVCTSQPLVGNQPRGKRWQVEPSRTFMYAQKRYLSQLDEKRGRLQDGILGAKWSGNVSVQRHTANQQCIDRQRRLYNQYRETQQDIDTVIEQEFGEHADMPSKDGALRDDRDRIDVPGRLVVVGDNL